MKKTYINPSIEVVKIQTSQMLANSPLLGGEYNNETILSRENNFNFEDEEF